MAVVKEKLSDLNERIQMLQDTLEAMEGISPEEEIELVKQMLDEAEVDRVEKLVGVARWRKQLQSEVKEVLGGEIKRLQGRKRTQERRVDSIAEYLKIGLKEVGGKVKHPLGTLWEQDNPKPSVVVMDASLVPEEYWMDHTVSEGGKVVNLSSGEYRLSFNYLTDEIHLKVVDKDKIGVHWQETGEQIPGTVTTQGTHIRFR